MRRTAGSLTALKVSRLAELGMHPDGGGLYLQVTRGAGGTINKSWVYRYATARGERYMGLGALLDCGLADARRKAADARRLREQGTDPIEHRRAAKQATALETATARTFKEAADAYVKAHRAGWRNVKHAAQWGTTLATYAEPVIGRLAVQAVDTGLVLKILEPIWTTKPETAGRLRGRIEAVLDWATARGLRSGENPARWRGHLDKLLPARSKVRKVKHFAALPYVEIGSFMTGLRSRDGVAARALEFLILTATRTGETIEATWNELDLPNAIWTIPAERMKSAREHRVPLAPAAVAILERMRETACGKYVFASASDDRPLSNMALLMLLRRMGRGDLTVHGFRSTFRDWAAELTNFPREVCEMALAHAIGDAVEAAYRRGDLFAKRRALATAWAEFCAKASVARGTVVPLHKAVI